MYIRGKKIVAKYKGTAKKSKSKGKQLFNVDGEDLTFNSKVTWEAMKQNLEVCFDSDRYFREYEWFVPKMPRSKL